MIQLIGPGGAGKSTTGALLRSVWTSPSSIRIGWRRDHRRLFA
jgi:adenylate kinase family enzyme